MSLQKVLLYSYLTETELDLHTSAPWDLTTSFSDDIAAHADLRVPMWLGVVSSRSLCFTYIMGRDFVPLFSCPVKL